MVVPGRICERSSKPLVAFPHKTCKMVHHAEFVEEGAVLLVVGCVCVPVFPSVAFKTGGIYKLLAEEGLQCTCIPLKDVSGLL